MSTTVLEALQNAKVNFENLGSMAGFLKTHPLYMIGMEQLKNGVEALEEGKESNFVLQSGMFEDIIR